MQSLTTQWQSKQPQREQILKTSQHHGEQMRQGLHSLGQKLQRTGCDLLAKKETQKLKEKIQVVGSKLSQLNISKLKEGIATSSTTDPNADLKVFNDRMKEEAMRRDVRREAEEACLKTMRDHLESFLRNQPEGTYEEWIFALHPENTQDVSLIMEQKEVDLRFYVEESDHRQLWNGMVSDPSRQIAGRARIFGSPKQNQDGAPVDLLASETDSGPSVFIDNFNDGGLVNPLATKVKECPSVAEGDLLSF